MIAMIAPMSGRIIQVAMPVMRLTIANVLVWGTGWSNPDGCSGCCDMGVLPVRTAVRRGIGPCEAISLAQPCPERKKVRHSGNADAGPRVIIRSTPALAAYGYRSNQSGYDLLQRPSSPAVTLRSSAAIHQAAPTPLQHVPEMGRPQPPAESAQRLLQSRLTGLRKP